VVAFLGSVLAQSLRRKGMELEEKREELMDLRIYRGHHPLNARGC